MAKVNGIRPERDRVLIGGNRKCKVPAPPAKQWYLKSVKGHDVVLHADINVQEAWKITTGKPSVTVAILDLGFDLDHPAFSTAGKIVSPSDYLSKPHKPIYLLDSLASHGTRVAGVAVANMIGDEIVGVSPGSSFMPVRIPSNPSEDLLIRIFKETSRKADVIACSWAKPPINAPLSAEFHKVIKKIVLEGGPNGNGCVICFAAGNYNAPIKHLENDDFLWLDESIDQVRTTNGPIINGLAAHPDVITVSSSTSLNKKALYSNWGKEISLCAPSNNFHPFSKRFTVQGRRDVWTTEADDVSKLYTDQFGGTSSAVALVAGAAALVRSANPFLTATEIKQVLQDSTDKIVDKDEDPILGVCKGNYIKGHSEWFGFGKLNAGKAVSIAHKILINKNLPKKAGSYILSKFKINL